MVTVFDEKYKIIQVYFGGRLNSGFKWTSMDNCGICHNKKMAEAQRFELWEGRPSPVFKTDRKVLIIN
ncbi:hypothetical protein A9G38_09515 [Gilliamella sp. Imp1-1]|nr:hypothetical protein A9G38_09515 [Gilliamella apicola]